MIEDFDAEVTPALLSALAHDLRGCRFLLETGASHRLLDQLEARALDVPMWVGSSVAQLWFQGMLEGRGDDDFTTITKMLEEWTGVTVDGRSS